MMLVVTLYNRDLSQTLAQATGWAVAAPVSRFVNL
jgi:hypothetical protein